MTILPPTIVITGFQFITRPDGARRPRPSESGRQEHEASEKNQDQSTFSLMPSTIAL
jgi:hypothetical protein